ncbi:MAG: hypothetical protein UU47_C0015G0022 [candidate division TM6 bacterium GW2011_GWE2_41_16]|nr:MAG: hypothetical protein UU47_C0015G0022 [candidate division TM6 bacterium GW2011_GWE2_41_16]
MKRMLISTLSLALIMSSGVYSMEQQTQRRNIFVGNPLPQDLQFTFNDEFNPDFRSDLHNKINRVAFMESPLTSALGKAIAAKDVYAVAMLLKNPNIDVKAPLEYAKTKKWLFDVIHAPEKDKKNIDLIIVMLSKAAKQISDTETQTSGAENTTTAIEK